MARLASRSEATSVFRGAPHDEKPRLARGLEVVGGDEEADGYWRFEQKKLEKTDARLKLEKANSEKSLRLGEQRFEYLREQRMQLQENLRQQEADHEHYQGVIRDLARKIRDELSHI